MADQPIKALINFERSNRSDHDQKDNNDNDDQTLLANSTYEKFVQQQSQRQIGMRDTNSSFNDASTLSPSATLTPHAGPEARDSGSMI